MSFLLSASDIEVTTETVDILLPLVREYDVSTSRNLCEETMLQLPITIIEAAIKIKDRTWKLEKQEQRCLEGLTFEESHDNLEILLDDASPATLGGDHFGTERIL